jgi:hypothetical protein
VATDPVLQEQLNQAAAESTPVEAVVTLKPDSIEPKAVEECAQRLVSRVKDETGVDPHDVNVLSNLGLVMVSAKPEFLQKLIDQPEVESAAANTPVDPL